jgi:hypothetical protein
MVLTEFQKAAHQEIDQWLKANGFHGFTFHVRGETEPYYLAKIDGFELFIHEDGLQMFGDSVEICDEIYDFKDEKDLIEKFIKKIAPILKKQ